MNEKEILIKVADTIDEQTVKISIQTVKEKKIPFIGIKTGQKTLKKSYQIKGSTLRTMVRISKLLLTMETGPKPDNNYLEWLFANIADNGYKLAQCVATAIHNQKSETPKKLIEELYDNFTAEDLFKVVQAVIDKLNVVPFLSTIASVRTISIIQPESASPTEQTEIIASGEQSEVLSNILGSAKLTCSMR